MGRRAASALTPEKTEEGRGRWVSRLRYWQTLILAFALVLAQLTPSGAQFGALLLVVILTSTLALITLPYARESHRRITVKAAIGVGGLAIYWAWSALIAWPKIYSRFVTDPRVVVGLALAVVGALLIALLVRLALARTVGGGTGLTSEAAVLLTSLLLMPFLQQTGFVPLYVCTFVAAYCLLDRPQTLRLFYISFLCFSAVLAAYAIAQYVAQGGRQWLGYYESLRLGGGAWFRDTTDLGCFLTVAAALSVGTYPLVKPRRARALVALCAVILCTAVTLTWSRTAWLFLALVLLLIPGRQKFCRVLAIAAAVGMVVLVQVVRQGSVGSLLTPHFWTGQLIVRCKDGWKLFVEHPVFGGGVGIWALLGRTTGRYSAHLIPLQLLDEVGVIGTSWAVALVAVTVRSMSRARRTGDIAIRGLMLPPLLGLGGMLLWSFTNAECTMPCLAILLLVLTAGALQSGVCSSGSDAGDDPRAHKEPARSNSRLVAALSIAALLALAAGISQGVQRDVQSRSALPVIPAAPRPPVIDGRVGEDEWRDALEVTGFVDWRSGGTATAHTKCLLSYDAHTLYLAFVSQESDERVIERLAKDEPQNDIWQSDSVEVHLDPRNLHRDEYAFFVSSANRSHQTQIANVYGAYGHVDCGAEARQPWSYDWSHATSVGNTRWTAEIAIPTAEMGTTTLRKGDVIGLQLARNRPSASPGKEGATASWPFAHAAMNIALEFQDLRLGDARALE